MLKFKDGCEAVLRKLGYTWNEGAGLWYPPSDLYPVVKVRRDRWEYLRIDGSEVVGADEKSLEDNLSMYLPIHSQPSPWIQ